MQFFYIKPTCNHYIFIAGLQLPLTKIAFGEQWGQSYEWGRDPFLR